MIPGPTNGQGANVGGASVAVGACPGGAQPCPDLAAPGAGMTAVSTQGTITVLATNTIRASYVAL